VIYVLNCSLACKPEVSVKCAFVILKHVCDIPRCLKLIKVSLGICVRPLIEDEHLYLRLCKLGKCVLAL
jgi:hypothetical protein